MSGRACCSLSHYACWTCHGISPIDGDVHGLIVGSNIDSAVAEASKIEGLNKLMHVDDDSFNNILAENLTQLILFSFHWLDFFTVKNCLFKLQICNNLQHD